MSELTPGEKIYIPSTVQGGPFVGERLVTIETKEGPISGFVPGDCVIERTDGSFIMGVVKSVTEDTLTVLLSGSFFTTTGLAFLSPASPVERALEST